MDWTVAGVGPHGSGRDCVSRWAMGPTVVSCARRGYLFGMIRAVRASSGGYKLKDIRQGANKKDRNRFSSISNLLSMSYLR